MYEIIQHRALLQTQRLPHGEDALHKAATTFTMTAKRILPPQYARPQQPLNMIVGRLYSLLIHKAPQRRLYVQQILTERRRLRVGARRTSAQPVPHGLAYRLQFEVQLLATAAAAEPMPFRKQDADRGQALVPIDLGHAAALHQFLEIPLQMRPAQLPQPQLQPAVDRPTIRTH